MAQHGAAQYPHIKIKKTGRIIKVRDRRNAVNVAFGFNITSDDYDYIEKPEHQKDDDK